MSTILNPKYLSLPEQVQKNKNDIEIINQYLQNVYKTSSTLTEDTTSINIENTDIDINNLNFGLLIDRQGHIYKIVDVIGEVVYLSFLTNIPGGTEYNFTGEWVSDNNEYYENDLVLYNGNLYLCEVNIVNSSTPPNEDIAHWSLFVGYGNDISEFVNFEYGRSENEVNIPNSGVATQRGVDYSSSKGAITLNGTATNTFSSEYDIDFKSSNGCVLCAFNNTKYDETNNGYIQLRRKGGDYADYVDFKQINNFKVISGEVEFDKIRVVVSTGYSVNNLIVKPMLKKGTTIPNVFQEWNGYPLHPKDIETPTLWENATPFATCDEQTINVENLTNYKKILVGYKSWKDNKNLYYSMFNTDIGDNYINIIEMTASATNTKVRPIQILSTTSIKIGSAYKNQTLNNSECVPVVIYGLKY